MMTYLFMTVLAFGFVSEGASQVCNLPPLTLNLSPIERETSIRPALSQWEKRVGDEADLYVYKSEVLPVSDDRGSGR